MPKRMLSEGVLTSPTIDKLSVEGELFFYRLLVVCDDHGRMDARPQVLRAKCYPLRVDSVKSAHVEAWVDELASAGLVTRYEHDGTPYVYMTKWRKHQRLRVTKSKYPDPEEPGSSISPQVAAGSGRKRPEARSESVSGEKPAASPPPGAGHRELVQSFHDGFLAATGAKPSWGAKEGKHVKALLARQPLAECIRRLGIFFGPDRPGWLTSYDLATFLQHFDKFATATGPPTPRRRRDPQIDSLLAIRNGDSRDADPSSGNLAHAQGSLSAGGSGPRREDSGGA